MKSLRSVLLLLCLSLPAAATVRAQTDFTCPEGGQYSSGVHITLPVNANNPSIEDDIPNPYFVAVMGLHNTVPVLAVSTPGDISTCSSGDPLASVYSATLPSTGEVPPSEQNAIAVTSTTGVYQADIAEASGAPGEYLIAIDGGSSTRQDREGDVYDIAISPDMVASGISLTAYLFAVGGTYNPQLSLVDEDGRVVRDASNAAITCDDAGSDCYGDPASLESAVFTNYQSEPHTGTAKDAMLTVPLTDDMAGTTLHLRADTSGANGEYSLWLHLGSGIAVTTVVRATMTENADGTLALACDDETVFEHGVKLMLPPQMSIDGELPYRVTLLATPESLPVLGVFNAAGEGQCYEQTPEAVTYAVQFPDLAIPPSSSSATALLPTDATTLVIGNRQNSLDVITVIIEGYAVAASNTVEPTPEQTDTLLPATISGAQFDVVVSPGMAAARDFVNAYMISLVDTLDGLVGQVDDSGAIITGFDGQPVLCDNAGVVLMCQDGSSVLTGFQLTLADGRVLPAFGLDAMLKIPVLPENVGQTLHIVTSGIEPTTGGAYVLVLRIKPD